MAENSNTLEIVVRVVDQANATLKQIEAQLTAMSLATQKNAEKQSTAWGVVKENVLAANATLKQIESQSASMSATSQKTAEKQSTAWGMVKENILAVMGVYYSAMQVMNKVFSMMEEGAQAHRVEEAFGNMAKNTGQSIDAMVAKMRELTGETIDDTTLMSMALKAMIRGMSFKEVETALEAARVASRTNAIPIQQAFEQIAFAIEMKIPRALARMGLVSRDESSRMQRLANEGVIAYDMLGLVADKTAERLQMIGKISNDQVDAMQRFKATWASVMEALSKEFADLMTPLIDKISDILDKIIKARSMSEYRPMSDMKGRGFSFGGELLITPEQIQKEINREKKYYEQPETTPQHKPVTPEDIQHLEYTIEQGNANKSINEIMKEGEKILRDQKIAKQGLVEVDILEATNEEGALTIIDKRIKAQEKLLQTQTDYRDRIVQNMEAERKANTLDDQKEQIYLTRLDATNLAMMESTKNITALNTKRKELTATSNFGTQAWVRERQALSDLRSSQLDLTESTGGDLGEAFKTDILEERIKNAKQMIVDLDIAITNEENASVVEKYLEQINKLRKSIVEWGNDAKNTATDIARSNIKIKEANLDLAESQRTMSRAEIAVGRVDAIKDEIANLEKERDVYEGNNTQIDKYNAKTAEIIAAQKRLADAQLEVKKRTGSTWEGMGRALEDLVREEKSAFELGYTLAKEAAQAMQQAFSDFFFDMMQGKLKSLKDYVKSFLESISRAVANFAAQTVVQNLLKAAVVSFGGTIHTGGYLAPEYHEGGLVTGMRPLIPVYHEGGYVPRFHTGGLNDDEVSAVLQKGEYVVSKKGVDMLDKINKGQALGDVNVAINVENQTQQPITAKQTGARFDGKQYIVSVVLENISNYGALYHATKGR